MINSDYRLSEKELMILVGSTKAEFRAALAGSDEMSRVMTNNKKTPENEIFKFGTFKIEDLTIILSFYK